MINYATVIDADVLYSASLRDFLLRLACDGSFSPFWSDEIHEEWIRNLLKNRPELKRENLERTRRNMDSRFPKALVGGYESIIPTLKLPDQGDRHVLAAAIHAEADSIITFNLKHFPKAALEPYGIEAMSPDKFVLRLIQEKANLVLMVVKTHRVNLTRLPKTVDEYLATLEKQKLTKTVAFLREHKGEL